MSNFRRAFDARNEYRQFRILVIGRANAGKTTLLKRVCNTTKEPCIYDAENNNLIEPTSDRGIQDINHPFAFTSNPQFIFHDSPGFEAGDESQIRVVQDFIANRARSTEVNDQLHAIWYCFEPNKARLLLDSDRKFFETKIVKNVPVIAIATKFDFLMAQVFTRGMQLDKMREEAINLLYNDLETPLRNSKFPPRAYVCLEDMHDDNSNHQEQVKELMQKTADALDDLALKMLFVSVQRNNLEMCIRYAIKHIIPLDQDLTTRMVIQNCLIWFGHLYYENYEYRSTEQDDGLVGLINRRGTLRGQGVYRGLVYLRGNFQNNCDQLGSYPRKAIEKIPILRLYQAKKRQAKQEVYKTAISDIILAHCFSRPPIT